MQPYLSNDSFSHQYKLIVQSITPTHFNVNRGKGMTSMANPLITSQATKVQIKLRTHWLVKQTPHLNNCEAKCTNKLVNSRKVFENPREYITSVKEANYAWLSVWSAKPVYPRYSVFSQHTTSQHMLMVYPLQLKAP